MRFRGFGFNWKNILIFLLIIVLLLIAYNVYNLNSKFRLASGVLSDIDGLEVSDEGTLLFNGELVTGSVTQTITSSGGGGGGHVWVDQDVKVNSSPVFNVINLANLTTEYISGFTALGNIDINDFNITNVSKIGFNTVGCDPDNDPEGTICWNPDQKTINVIRGNGQVIQVGKEVGDDGINNVGSIVSDGTVVTLSGFQGDNPTFILADSTNVSLSGFVGVVTAGDDDGVCDPNDLCPVTEFGFVNNVDTSSWSAGDKLYIDPNNPGELTNVIPVLPNNPVWVATVGRVSATVGSIFVSPRIDQSDGFLINNIYVTDSVNITNRLQVDNDTFYVDSVNDRVGIGTATPSTTFHISDVSDTVFRVVAGLPAWGVGTTNPDSGGIHYVASNNGVNTIKIENSQNGTGVTSDAKYNLKSNYQGGDYQFNIRIDGADDDLVFENDNVAIMTLDGATNNVGIGTNNPVVELQVQGNIYNNGTLSIGKISQTSFDLQVTDEDSSANIKALVYSNTSSGHSGRWTSEVFGGTIASPSAIGSSRTMGSFRFNGAYNPAAVTTGAIFRVISTEAWNSTNKGTSFVFEGTPTGEAARSEWVRFEDGRVGIEESSPTELLVVGDDVGDVGSGKFIVLGDSSGGKPGFVIGEDGNNRFLLSWNQFNNYVSFTPKNAGSTYTDTLVIRDDKVGVGDTNPSVALHVTDTSIDGDLFRLEDSDGTCSMNPESGAITTTCTSDERLKENIRDVNKTEVLEYLKVWSICMKEYEIIESGNTMIGPIAQCVQQYLPELVDETELLVSRTPYNYTYTIEETKEVIETRLEPVERIVIYEEFNQDGTSYLANKTIIEYEEVDYLINITTTEEVTEVRYNEVYETYLTVDQPDTNRLLLGAVELYKRNQELETKQNIIIQQGVEQKNRIDVLENFICGSYPGQSFCQ